MDKAEKAFCNIQSVILADPCLMRFNHQRLVVLRTNFSLVVFGFVVYQQATDAASKVVMAAYCAGKDFLFMTKELSVALQPVAFGGCKCRGNKTRLHSHLGEGFSGNWAINKNRHMLLGTQFIWVTDCYAIRFILLYEGANPAILRLPMRLMCWDMDIVHQNDINFTNADYLSHLGKDICFNLHFKEYLDFSKSLQSWYSALVNLPMCLENMPYYRGPRLISPRTDMPDTPEVVEATYCHTLISSVALTFGAGMDYLLNIPVHFGKFETVTLLSAHLSTNDEFPCLAQQVLFYNWAVYSLGGGHFATTIRLQNLPFWIMLACKQVESGRALFHKFTSCSQVFGNKKEMLNHICALGDSSHIHGYLIHLLQFRDSKATSTFWQL